jgi:hypothetical protein
MNDPRQMKKMTVRFFSDDLEFLRMAYPGTGYNEILRALAARHVKKLKTAAAASLSDKLTTEELKSI